MKGKVCFNKVLCRTCENPFFELILLMDFLSY
jgi:hypothetical protein